MSWPDTDDSVALRQEFAARLDASPGSAWSAAFAAVPRHVFVPGFYVQGDDRAWKSVAWGEPGYLEAVYSDQALTTQLDEQGVPTSSSSEPSLMMAMLDALDVQAGDTVFELGTGTGYNAALLSHRLGDSHVTSVDVDPELTDAAWRRLSGAGYRPYLGTGDGAQGWPGRAPYARLIATAALRSVPAAFLQQAEVGAVIVAPIGYGVVRVTVTEPGHATGRYLPGSAHFMPRRSPGAAPAFDVAQAAEPSETKVPPADVLDRLQFPLSIAMPGFTSCSWRGGDGELSAVGLWTEDGSTVVAGVSGEVRQTGPRRLWDVVEDVDAAFDGTPRREDFHVTISPGGQAVWYRDPDGPAWALPAMV
ncbi:hypothetical protein ACIF70_39220 [Actinacidiphila glaucinigra]|uniref:hypothetical protein n=1 Tax=Actinacidiphila glaucinigra TaxID=235986 RepID=UPI0037C719A7